MARCKGSCGKRGLQRPRLTAQIDRWPSARTRLSLPSLSERVSLLCAVEFSVFAPLSPSLHATRFGTRQNQTESKTNGRMKNFNSHHLQGEWEREGMFLNLPHSWREDRPSVMGREEVLWYPPCRQKRYAIPGIGGPRIHHPPGPGVGFGSFRGISFQPGLAVPQSQLSWGVHLGQQRVFERAMPSTQHPARLLLLLG